MKLLPIKQARTFMPEIIAPGTGLSPATQKSVAPFNNVLTIQDVLNGKQYQLPGGGGDWSSGEDVSHSYREQGDDYKRQERDMEIFKRMLTPSPNNHFTADEQWEVSVNGGRKVFPSLGLATEYRKKLMNKGVPVKSITRTRLAQNKTPDKTKAVAFSMEKTFMVESINISESSKLNGAAFCVAPNIFVTCAHVVHKYNKNEKVDLDVKDTAQKVQLSLIQNGKKFPAKLVALHGAWDIAILSCEIAIQPFPIKTEFALGDDILTVGSPHGFENEVSFGNVGGMDRKIYTYDNAPEYTFVDLAAFTGNSGGPIIDEATGGVIAMLTAIVTASGEFGLNAGLPAKYIKQFCIMNNVGIKEV